MDELELVRRARPGTPDPDPAVKERARQQLFLAIAEAEQELARESTFVDASVQRFPRRRWRWGLGLVAAGLAAVLAWGLVELTDLGGEPVPFVEEPGPPPPPPSPPPVGAHEVEVEQISIAGHPEPEPTTGAGSSSHAGTLIYRSELARVGDADVVRPVTRGDWPIVVLLHPHTMHRDRMLPLAEAIASGGAVVLNAAWIDVYGLPNEEQFATFPSNIACAIAYAEQRASELGGDASRVTVFAQAGAGYSATIAVTKALEPAEGCAVTHPGLPETVVTFSADTRNVHDDVKVRDQILEGDPVLIEKHDLYNNIGRGRSVRFRILQGTEEFYTEARGAGGLDPLRISPVDEGERFAQAMLDAGYPVEYTPIDKLGAVAHAPSIEPVQKVIEIVLREAYAAGYDGER
ncbi:MAG: hypothetical protein R3320_01085 [Nitriliruptorales bacterium]|nr:hypothetical protein [Nitriliruptorales bacterium]